MIFRPFIADKEKIKKDNYLMIHVNIDLNKAKEHELDLLYSEFAK